MPVFHTRTIESILAPVAQQVSRLVIIHEEAGDTNAMPDLSVPVNAVSKAVTNLVKVGKETINSSDDIILRQDMPVSLRRVESASKALEEASTLFKDDPFSQIGRVRLIEGARGILGGTSSLLLVFDQSEVRKIIAQCKKFLSYLDVTEVIESMDDLVQFVKDVTPCLTRVTRDVDARQRELTHTLHREIIVRCLDSVKTLAPILICSMKIFIQLKTETKITNEAIENRNYLGSRMTDEINEIIRVLQLTSADEDEWDLDYLNCMRRALATILAKMQAAHDFLENSSDVIGGIGEKSLRHILDLALKISDYCHPAARAAIRKQVGDLRALIDALCELRSQNKGTSPQAQSMARSISGQLKNLVQLIEQAIRDMERDGLQIPRQTLEGRLEQALRWLANPGFNDRGLGSAAIRAIIEEARRLAASCPPATASDLRRAAAEVEALARKLEDLVNRGLGNSPAALALARQLGQKLKDLKKLIDRALIDRVVNDFLDIHTPLKQFTEAVLAPVGTPNREGNFVDKAANLKNFSNAAVRTARDVASGSAPNKRIAENLNNAATNVESLCPQLINAGRIRLDHPDNRNADEHFNNLRNQYADGLQRMRNLVDEAIDANDFIQALEDAIRRHTAQCENAIATGDPQKMVDNASAIARLANRICNVAKQEADNSEDPAFINRINRALNNLQNTISPMVADAKDVALNIHDPNAANKWRASNNKLIDAVGGVKNALAPQVPDLNRLNLDDLEPRATSYQQATIHPPAISHPPANAVPQPAKYHPIQLMSTDYELPKPRSPIHSNRYITKMNAAPAVPYQVSHLIHSPTRANAAIPPPRPIPPVTVSPAIPRPPPPQETDDEDERFPSPSPNQPIMMAAHGLHQEIKDWSSKDNEIIAAAKRMALLMARLSQLVRGEGSKKDLISCAKAIEEASKHIANLAKEQAKLCTDKRMRTTILQVCERIPTMGTQLSILCTVKATMLGCQASEEDREATEMLEGNAKFIMDSVKETVKACESASIKIRSDAGVRMVWQRKPNWHQRI